MPTHKHYAKVAKDLSNRISGKDFESIRRIEIVEMLREASGESSKFSTAIAAELECALLNENVRVFPHLKDTAKAEDVIRAFPKRSATAEFVDALTQPSETTDIRLGEIIRKVGSMKSLLEASIPKDRPVDDNVIDIIDDVREKISRGRIFTDSAALIREMREERDKELDRAIRGNEK